MDPVPNLPSVDGLAAPSLPSLSLTRPQKAAVIVRVLLSQGVKLSIADLPEPVQAELARHIGSLQRLDADTVNSVIDEFAKELSVGGLPTSGGLENALELLDGSISASAASRLRAQSGLSIVGDPWERILAASAETLLPILETESAEVGAVILSKLPVHVAAECLGLLPGPRARRLTYAISRTAAVTPDAVTMIGRAVSSQLAVEPVVVFSKGPVERVGAILNFSRSATRNDVLSGLEETDKNFADEVRKVIFTFANIPDRLDTKDIPKVIREVNQEALVRALAAAEAQYPEVPEFLLGGLSQRMATNLKGEIEDVGELSEEDAEAAMTEVINTVRAMEEAGDIFLVAPADPE